MEHQDWEVLCIAITNHTNDGNGDPFLGYKQAKTGCYVATSVPDFMDTLLDPWRNVIQRGRDTTLFFFGCGAIVNEPEGFGGLRASVVRYRFSSAVAFTAKHFHPPFTTHLMISFTQLILVEGFPLCEAFPNILEQSGLGMHSDVILMTATPGDDGPTVPLLCTRYSWAHSDARPWGNSLPVQCPQCGCPTPWKRTYADFSLKYIVFQCTYKGCGRVNKQEDKSPRKKYTMTYKAPPGSLLLPGRKRGAAWLEIPLAKFPEPDLDAVTDILDTETV
ncbi:uncharacterized protein F5891DRAFT_1188873 [Suillus fuscotomentosus]|uniref:Uncharacterized protein n=1 Tax=Suillus fuscotomentosus TaxID=1912939 RepID=A0AAD4E5M7_9AGAM|nr:uncharacterized protein F5891DRAFT_1188873 [Suillus fuscotomentosus]KAG1900175.1 hypothetical protein F5891DRAFT_1188873 [Suillus fuscotomentosus]